MKLVRRDFMSLIAKALGAVATVSVWPSYSFAKRNVSAFSATALSDAISARYPGHSMSNSDKITLKAPAIAENGAVVPISVKTSLPNVSSISIFVEKNPAPLSASFELGPINIADVSIRVRMGQTSNLLAVVESDGQLYKVQKEVKVTIGGCGG